MTTKATNDGTTNEKNTVPAKPTTKGTLKKPAGKAAEKTTTKKATAKTTTTKRAAPKKATSAKTTAATSDLTETVTTLNELCAAFLKHLVATGKSAGTARSYAADLGICRNHFGGDTKVKSMTARKIATFFASDAVTKLRDGSDKNAITVAKIRRVFRQMVEFATAGGLFEKSPLPPKK